MSDPTSPHVVEGPAKGRPEGHPVVKALFAASGNLCAYSAPDFNRAGCETKLYEPGWTSVLDVVAHICGFKEGSCRYDGSLSDRDRNHYDNLMLLFPTHHRLVDELECERHTVGVLREMKRRHELANEQSHLKLEPIQVDIVVTMILEFAVALGVLPKTVFGEALATGGASVRARGTVIKPIDSGQGGTPADDGGSSVTSESGARLSTESGAVIRTEARKPFDSGAADTDRGTS